MFAAAAAAGPAPIQPIGDVGAWFRKLCASTSGILYEDQFLQVGPHGWLVWRPGNRGWLGSQWLGSQRPAAAGAAAAWLLRALLDG